MNLTGNYSYYYAFIGFDLMANNSNVDIKMTSGFGIHNSTTLDFGVHPYSPLYVRVVKFINIFIQNQLFNATITIGYISLSSSPPYYTSTKIQ